MSTRIGNNSFNVKSTFRPNKPPRYEHTLMGDSGSMVASGSAYFNSGWTVEHQPGNPYVIVATIEADINNVTNEPVTTGSSYVTTNWSMTFNVNEKDLLSTNIYGLNNGFGGWINNINTWDKNALEYFIANPPTTSSFIGDVVGTPIPIEWDEWHGFSYNATSISASQVVHAMVKNGCKTLPVVQPVLNMRMTVPNGYSLSTFVNNINRIYSKASVQSENAVPANFYGIMRQDSDPSSTTVVCDNGAGLPLIYGWKKLPPSIEQNGLTINISQFWEYGLWYQNIYGTRI